MPITVKQLQDYAATQPQPTPADWQALAEEIQAAAWRTIVPQLEAMLEAMRDAFADALHPLEKRARFVLWQLALLSPSLDDSLDEDETADEEED